MAQTSPPRGTDTAPTRHRDGTDMALAWHWHGIDQALSTDQAMRRGADNVYGNVYGIEGDEALRRGRPDVAPTGHCDGMAPEMAVTMALTWH